MRHGEGLARARHAQEHLVPLLPPQALDEVDDRLRLIAGRLELGDQLERTPALGPLDQIGIAGQRLEQVERGQAFDSMHGVGQRLIVRTDRDTGRVPVGKEPQSVALANNGFAYVANAAGAASRHPI